MRGDMAVVVVGVYRGANPALIHLYCIHLFNPSDAPHSISMYESMIY